MWPLGKRRQPWRAGLAQTIGIRLPTAGRSSTLACQTVQTEKVVNMRPCKVQPLRRLADVPVGRLQPLPQQRGLKSTRCLLKGQLIEVVSGVLPAKIGEEVRLLDYRCSLAGRSDHGRFHRVRQLPHVSRPLRSFSCSNGAG